MFRLLPMPLLLLACSSGDLSRAPTQSTERVDPVLTDGTKVVPADATNVDLFGYDASAAGDVNGDGYDDIIAGAWIPEAAYVYHGGPSGIDLTTETELVANDLYTSDKFGQVVSRAGDINGDGYDDVIVGSPWDGEHGSRAGAAHLYYGSPGGIDLASEVRITASDASNADEFGSAVDAGGDVNADGYGDLIIGAGGLHFGLSPGGGAYVYLGSAAGIDLASEVKLWTGGSYDDFGDSVSACGDIDNDGYDDIVVGAPGEDDGRGAAYVYYGGPGGVSAGDKQRLVNVGADEQDWYSRFVSGADVDGDGYTDVLIGQPGSLRGQLFLYRGGPSGVEWWSEQRIEPWDLVSDESFGYRGGSAGDVDGDGYSDVVVSAMYSDVGADDTGALYVYFGSATGLLVNNWIKLNPADSEEDDYLGLAASAAGDVDGDGYDDLLASYRDDDAGTDAGAVAIFRGACSVETFYWDGDGDGYGDPNNSMDGCEPLAGFVVNFIDCNDSDPLAWTGRAEVCDGVDNNCDGITDDDATDRATWYADNDGDGHGDPAGPAEACLQPTGYVANDSDCNDSEALAWTGAVEICDGVDNDCDGINDNGADATPWYADADADGFGDPLVSTIACLQPPGYVANLEDCDDTEALAWTGADELCDGVDNDCDGVEDNDDALDALSWYADNDGDGHGDPTSSTTSCSAPLGYVGNSSDCNDTEALAWTGADEYCDGVDNDCDGIDDNNAADATTWYDDDDGDGYGDPSSTTQSCSPPPDTVSNPSDCDDTEPLAWTGADELCDGVDNDCDGITDNDDALDASTWYDDNDGDGRGDPGAATTSCSAPPGYVANLEDCDDTEALAWTGADELCDGVDNDCDGIEDNDDALDALTWYADSDGDGHGDPAANTTACVLPNGYVPNDSDCNDGEALAWTGADELCDGVDNDCDGVTDNDDALDALPWYADNDGDGYGNPAAATTACGLPIGHVANDNDCDDGEALAWTGADERCDGVDNDCDGITDNDDALDAPTWYLDADNDGFGDPNTSTDACAQPSGFVSNAGDCNDTEVLAWTGALELCDGVDNDCNGAIDDGATDLQIWYADADGDGHGDPATGVEVCTPPVGHVQNANDCDDAEPLAWMGADEVCDGIDNDCDGTVDVDAEDAVIWYADSDGDGHGDANAYIEACEAPSGYVDTTDDCDDSEALAWDGAEEVCDGADNDCNGTTDIGATDSVTWFTDNDGDGWGDPAGGLDSCSKPSGGVDNAGDCNDSEPLAWSSAEESCDGIDNNCDGVVDEGCDSPPEKSEPTGCGCDTSTDRTAAFWLVLPMLLWSRRRSRTLIAP